MPHKKSFPAFKKPMLATLIAESFDDENWIFERKLDGFRALAYCDGKKVQLYSRNEKDFTPDFPEVVNALGSLPHKCILDGELVAFKNGATSFERLTEQKEKPGKVYFYVFDILFIDGNDLREMELIERKKILRELFAFKNPIRLLSYRRKIGKQLFTEACEKKWEGLIAKNIHSEYIHKRSKDWVKIKCINSQEFIIVGYTDPEGERTGFGALLLGYYEQGALKYAGRVGTGFDEPLLISLSQTLKKSEGKTSPLAEKLNESDVHFVDPKLVCQIEFAEWTSDGKLRHPSFKGLRDDKDAKKIIKE